MGLLDSLLNWLRSLFFKQEMELSLVGLQNAGKTSLVNSIATGGYSEDMIPTVGFNMRKVTKGNVTIKLWDLGGQRRFRTMWERYCRGVTAILYVVDAADRDSVPISRSELHDLLTKPSLSGIPLLVVGNKIDKSEALSKQALVDQLGLESIADREKAESCELGSVKTLAKTGYGVKWQTTATGISLMKEKGHKDLSWESINDKLHMALLMKPTNTTQFEQIRFVPEAITIAKGNIMQFDLNIKEDFILCKAS
ncbi:hypothetical protein D5086_008426 [Populus alba]|uniref:Uncharacterized protein n=1 Tax=Populus alba TaxID=43335 RepID=A0ACC4CF84_POPAL